AEGDDLGVQAARASVETLSHDLAARHHHRPHHGVRRREPAAPRRELERPGHPARVVDGSAHASGSNAAANALASNGWRSSTFSPTPTSLMGTPSSRQIRTTIPPLAVPSSLVSTMPVRPTA